jgi:hypothetical protein
MKFPKLSRAALVVPIVAGLAALYLLALYLAHRPPEGGRNLLTIETPVSVELFEVRAASGQVLWRITSSPARVLASIHYGEVPPGYTQSIPASGQPRPFVLKERLDILALTTDWQFSHNGIAIGPDKFLGGSYLNGPRKPTPGPPKPGV